MQADTHNGARGYARVYGSPGERARLAGLLHAAWPLLVVVAAMGYLLGAALPAPEPGSTAIGLVALALAGAMAIAVARSRARLEAFIKGARGEEWVARRLAVLPSAYTVFHGLAPAEGKRLQRSGDYDHVVIGPTGVFAVETKNWSGAITLSAGQILYDGRAPDRPPLRQAKDLATELTEEVSTVIGRAMSVRPIVCFASDTVSGRRIDADGVLVIDASLIGEAIREATDDRLDDRECGQIAAHLRRRMAAGAGKDD